MKHWQMWLIVFYICFARVASEGFVMVVGISAFLGAIFFWVTKQ